MPVYVFQHPKTEEVVELVQGMNDEHAFIDEEGVEWNRVWFPLELNTSGSIDPWSKNDFMNTTGDQNGTLGDMMDRSEEMSQKRANECGGVDPIRENYYKDYSKKRKGTLHPDQLKNKSFENKNFKVDYD